jgi:hypothetical protein
MKRPIIKYRGKNENSNNMMFFKNLLTFEKNINISEKEKCF